MFAAWPISCHITGNLSHAVMMFFLKKRLEALQAPYGGKWLREGIKTTSFSAELSVKDWRLGKEKLVEVMYVSKAVDFRIQAANTFNK